MLQVDIGRIGTLIARRQYSDAEDNRHKLNCSLPTIAHLERFESSPAHSSRSNSSSFEETPTI